MEEEKWVKLYDYDGFMVSNYGNIKSLDRVVTCKDGRSLNIKGQLLTKRQVKPNSSPFVEVRKNTGVKKTVYVIRAVADHFVERPKKDTVYATPIDKDYTNTYYKNIKWITHRELMLKRR